MTLLRFDPFRDVERLTTAAWSRPRPTGLPMDAVRRDGELLLQFDLPGVDPDSIDVTVERNVLTVTAERHAVRGDGDEVLVEERRVGRLGRRLVLGKGLDTDQVRAAYHDGVLTLTFPVVEAVRPRRVEVQRGQEAPAVADAAEVDPAESGTAAA